MSFTHTGYATLFIGKLFASVRKASLYSTDNNSTALQRVVHTSEGVVHFIPVFTSTSVGSNRRSYLFIFATVLIDVDTVPKCLTETTSEIGVVQLHSVAEIAAKSPLLRSFSNHDGDGNENAKTAMGWLRKTTILYVHQASPRLLNGFIIIYF